MLFNSYLFLLGFLPLALGGFAVARRFGPRWARAWLVSGSLLFYAWAASAFVPLLVCSMIANFAAGRLLARSDGPCRSQILCGCIAANLGVLAWFRYASPAFPLGISFFTFSQIGFLLDCAAGMMAATGIGAYALFVGFFPHVTAGPLPAARDLLPQVAGLGDKPLDPHDLAVGTGCFIIGLLKKTLLAEPLSGLVTAGFSDPSGLSWGGAWLAALGWTLSLYFDFSGYSDMAIGLGRMFGLRYQANFASPYKAQSIIEFWQRWHMSMTRFLVATIHAPLTLAIMRRRKRQGLRSDRAAQCRPEGFLTMIATPIMLTMALAGVWHGSGLTFLVFGLLHGAFLVVNHAWRLMRPGPRSGSAPVVIARVLLTFLCVLLGGVMFRAASVGDAMAMVSAMLGGTGTAVSLDWHSAIEAAWIVGLLVIVWLAPNTDQIMQRTSDAGRAWLSWRPTMPWAVAMGCAATLGLLSIGGTTEFVYFRF